MFYNARLKNHLEQSSTVETNTLVVAEWNLNNPSNISKVGNYRYRPGPLYATHKQINPIYDPLDRSNSYTDATDSDTTIMGPYDEFDEPTLYIKRDTKKKLLYSLDDCLKPHRPRSGINYILFPKKSSGDKDTYRSRKYIDSATRTPLRPRYYLPDYKSLFKYWTSWRKESENGKNYERGIADKFQYITDAAPFVVYKEDIYTNKIVVKMQTNIGTETTYAVPANDPLYGISHATIPEVWRVQVLQGNAWVTIFNVNAATQHPNGGSVVGADGYFELRYGISNLNDYNSESGGPKRYRGQLDNTSLLPENAPDGDYYEIVPDEGARGTVSIRKDGRWVNFIPTYGWSQVPSAEDVSNGFVHDFTSLPKFRTGSKDTFVYREVEKIRGLRIVVTKMKRGMDAFELIEMSPRLRANVSEMVLNYDVTRTLGGIDQTAIPVGNLEAGTGKITLFDYDNSFESTNGNSIIAHRLEDDIAFTFYDITKNVNAGSAYRDYYIPLKTLYTEGKPPSRSGTSEVSWDLRDLFYYFEKIPAPEVFMRDVHLSFAIALLLDNAGFSNYVFRKTTTTNDPLIPYFFIPPEKNIVEILQELAIATQSAMYFDEYNNFVVMSKEYLFHTSIDDGDVRQEVITLSGNDKVSDDDQLPNIIEIASDEKRIYNSGTINYTERYIQKDVSTLRSASFLDQDKLFKYKPVLLWEASATPALRTRNEVVTDQSAYALAAVPLQTSLSTTVPYVKNHHVVNNIIDVGEGVYWITRYKGYLYSNGEIIRYDAMQYYVQGARVIDEQTGQYTENVWISSDEEYQRYFGELGFGHKMYPTGLLRIYAVPYYATVTAGGSINPVGTFAVNGDVKDHGRGQFSTAITEHQAGLNPNWKLTSNHRTATMTSKYLFDPVDSFNTIGPELNGNIYDVSISLVLAKNHEYRLRSPGVSYFRIIRNSKITKVKPDDKGYATFIAPANDTYAISARKDSNNLHPPVNPTVAPTPETVPPLNTGSTLSVKEMSDTVPQTTTGKSGISPKLPFVSGVMKNFMRDVNYTEASIKTRTTAQAGIIQSSALILEGPNFTGSERPRNYISYVYKSMHSDFLESNMKSFDHAGTRMRVIGKVENAEDVDQSPTGAEPVFNIPTDAGTQVITGGGGGIAVGVNPQTNNGYYFELEALSNTNLNDFSTSDAQQYNLHNIIFYKLARSELATSDATPSVPIKLWGGTASILIDSGSFAGQSRQSGDENITVNDIAVEWSKGPGNAITFFLYLNNSLLTSVVDNKPLPLYNNIALFVRGKSKVMFEHIYALDLKDKDGHERIQLNTPISKVFGGNNLTANNFLKYGINGMVQQSYLSKIDTQSNDLKYNIYYDEFGTILRECAYFDIRYDKAYPALFSKISPTFNEVASFTTSSYIPGPYGAQFLVFNHTDKTLNLDDTAGNYLRIQGVTITNTTTHEFKMDNFFEQFGNPADPLFVTSDTVFSPIALENKFREIKINRMRYGTTDFSLSSEYIQTQGAAASLMGWLINQVTRPRQLVGVKIFNNPTIQLGDIVSIDYQSQGVNKIAYTGKRFVVYNIEYNRSETDISNTLYLSEILS